MAGPRADWASDSGTRCSTQDTARIHCASGMELVSTPAYNWQCVTVGLCSSDSCHPDDGGNSHFWNIVKRLPDYPSQQPRRPSSLYSPPREPEISQKRNKLLTTSSFVISWHPFGSGFKSEASHHGCNMLLANTAVAQDCNSNHDPSQRGWERKEVIWLETVRPIASSTFVTLRSCDLCCSNYCVWRLTWAGSDLSGPTSGWDSQC